MNYFNRKWPAILLWPLSLLYGTIVLLRHFFYQSGIFHSFKVRCTVISVGNMTVGGTGKTPVVLFLAHFFSDKKVCILSRGYKRQSRGTVIVSDGHKLLAGIRQAGDEPFMLARRLGTVPVVVDSDRVRGARLAVKRFKPDIIILDDGFQHRRLSRDIDIVTIAAPRPFGNGFLLPAGPLREPLRLLNRADVLWINSFYDNYDEFKSQRPFMTIKAGYKPVEVKNKHKGIVKDLRNKSAIGFCALGNPNGFKKTLESLGVTLKDFIVFRDHHVYTPGDIVDIESRKQTCMADMVLTTEKDWVKLPLPDINNDWYYLKIDLKVEKLAILKELRKKIG